jgi:hypothetical protein
MKSRLRRWFKGFIGRFAASFNRTFGAGLIAPCAAGSIAAEPLVQSAALRPRLIAPSVLV